MEDIIQLTRISDGVVDRIVKTNIMRVYYDGGTLTVVFVDGSNMQYREAATTFDRVWQGG